VNAIDLSVLGVIGLSAIFAFARGFVRETLSIVAWVGAALVTFYGFYPVSTMMSRYTSMPLLAHLIAGVGLFVISLIVLTIITGYLARLVHSTPLSAIDRTFGLIFGIARGLVVVSLVYLALNVILAPADWPPIVKEAKSEPFLAQGADMLRGLLPQSLQIKSAAVVDDTQRALERAKEAQKAMRALSSPVAPLPAKPGQDQVPNYKTGDRRDLDRLIENAR